ncbi:anaerobic ribonucleotide reductase small subunit [Vibrio phage VB_VaC_TDDLMA]
MRYSYPQETLTEVPGEISLALSISGCDLGCKGCHSTETWNPNFGTELDEREMKRLLKKHKFCTCVVFYGGEWDIDNLQKMITMCHFYNKKVCLYTGRDLNYFSSDFLQSLDYIKVGKYIKELGGLQSRQTNQKFYDLYNNKEVIFYQ